MTLVDEALLAGASMLVQFQLATALCMVGTFAQAPIAHRDRIDRLIGRLQAWQSNDALLQLAPWYLHAASHETLLEELEHAIQALPRHPPSYTAIGFIPFGIALLAERLGKASWLDALIRFEVSSDRSPWTAMQWALARGTALQARGATNGALVLLDAAHMARGLDATFFAAYAAMRAGVATQGEASLLQQLSVSPSNHAQRATPNELSAREMQVARLVSLGNTNREIAEALFLSERTVERHLGNAFEKLHLNSRTQLALWIAERNQGSTIDLA